MADDTVSKLPFLDSIFRDCDLDRFWSHVDKSGECWLWRAATHRGGYGRFHIAGGERLAHRASYEITHGAIPAGMVIDHVCRNRACVNPSHLRVVTARTNTLENSLAPSALNAAKTHCVRGHELIDRTTAAKAGWRYCKKCAVINQTAYRERKKLTRLNATRPADLGRGV